MILNSELIETIGSICILHMYDDELLLNGFVRKKVKLTYATLHYTTLLYLRTHATKHAHMHIFTWIKKQNNVVFVLGHHNSRRICGQQMRTTFGINNGSNSCDIIVYRYIVHIYSKGSWEMT